MLRCARCQVTVSRELTELRDPSLLSVADGQEHLPSGFFRVAGAKDQEDHLVAGEGEFILNLRDLANTRHHSDFRRSQGCCGCDGLHGMNLVCANGHEIGTERSDCWMPHYAHFPPNMVETVER